MIEAYLGTCGIWLFAMCFILFLASIAMQEYQNEDDKAMVRYTVYGMALTPLAPVLIIGLFGLVFYSIVRTVLQAFKD